MREQAGWRAAEAEQNIHTPNCWSAGNKGTRIPRQMDRTGGLLGQHGSADNAPTWTSSQEASLAFLYRSAASPSRSCRAPRIGVTSDGHRQRMSDPRNQKSASRHGCTLSNPNCRCRSSGEARLQDCKSCSCRKCPPASSAHAPNDCLGVAVARDRQGRYLQPLISTPDLLL